MGKGLSFLTAVLSILFLNSCTVPGQIIVGSGILYGLHKEAKTHYPDKVPDLPKFSSFSNMFKSSADHDVRKSSKGADHPFGFDCTKVKDSKDRPECFDLFIKSLSEKKEYIKTNQKSNTTKSKPIATVQQQIPRKSTESQDVSKKVVIQQDGIEESAFFENTETSLGVKKLKITKKQQMAQVLRNNAEAFKSETRPQEFVAAETKSKQSLNFVSSHLLKWVNAWESQDVNSYISFYSKDFTGTKRSRPQWEAHRYHALKVNPNMSIQLSNIKIYENKNIVEANFIQRFKSDSFSDIGIKELIWTKYGSDWRIIKETWMPKEKTSWIKEADYSMNFVNSQLLNWANSWENQDVSSYISFYSKSFIGTKKSRSEWEAHRHHALKANSNLSIKVNNIKLHKTEDLIEVNFIQRFNSDRFSDVGIKELIWIKTGSDWKILKETWLPS